MNPEKRWIKMADMVPGDVFEKKYKHFFKSKTGNIAKTLRIGAKMPMEANEYLIQKNQPDKKRITTAITIRLLAMVPVKQRSPKTKAL